MSLQRVVHESGAGHRRAPTPEVGRSWHWAEPCGGEHVRAPVVAWIDDEIGDRRADLLRGKDRAEAVQEGGDVHAPRLPISITMAGRTSSFRAATFNPLDMHRACRWSSPTPCSATWAAQGFRRSPPKPA